MSDLSPLGLFVESIFAEALHLLEELAVYIAHERAAIERTLSPPARDLLSAELSRMSVDLMRLMAWLLMEKAIAAGEVEHGDAARIDAFRMQSLSQRQPPHPGVQELPLAVRGLIDRCRRVTAQALDVESMLRDRRAAEQAPGRNPAG